jgi:hypothetical protein
MTVWIYVDTSKQVGDPDHLKVFATTDGATSLRALADGLNAQGIPTARGNGRWSAVQVAPVLEKL